MLGNESMHRRVPASSAVLRGEGSELDHAEDRVFPVSCAMRRVRRRAPRRLVLPICIRLSRFPVSTGIRLSNKCSELCLAMQQGESVCCSADEMRLGLGNTLWRTARGKRWGFRSTPAGRSGPEMRPEVNVQATLLVHAVTGVFNGCTHVMRLRSATTRTHIRYCGSESTSKSALCTHGGGQRPCVVPGGAV